MALTLQNLRAVGAGTEPSALLPGQIAFNILDKIMFVGDGTDVKTRFDGTSSIGVPGEGWYSMPMDFSQFSTNFIVNPEVYGDIPTDGQVLTWDETLNHTIWTNGGSTSNLVYSTTNAAVAAAPGATLTIKINNAIGVVSPDSNDWVVVSGLPGDIYQGAYYFSGATWNKAANYAFPTAAQVPYSNTTSGLTANDVQEGIDELDVLVTAAQASANSAFAAAGIAQDAADAAQTDATQALADAAAAQATADAALPKAGGTMTGPLIAQEVTTTTLNTNQINVASGYGISFSTGVLGTIFGISGTVSSTSTTTAASSAGLKTAYDLANSALQRAGGTMTGAITFVAGQLFPISGIDIATTGQLGVVQIGTNIDVAAGVISVKAADASNLGVVQVGTNIDVLAGTISVKTADTSNLGVVIVGTNIDVTSGTISVKTGSASDFGILKVGTNLDVAAGVISVASSSTTQAGIVQLNNTTTSTSTTQALTAAAGNSLQLAINGLTVASNTKLAGSLNCATGKVASVTTDGTAQGFVVGNNPPNPAVGNANYYMIVTTGSASYSPPGGGGPYAPQNGDWFLSNGTTWQYLGVGARPSYASTTTAGIVQLSDDAATQAGTNGTLAVTPASLQSKISDSTSTTSSIAIASSTAVKSAYDLANAALPKAGGTMTGGINLAAAGVTFSDASQLSAITNSTSTTSSTTAASATGVKSAYDLANAALPKAGGTMTGDLTFSGPLIGVIFNDTSTVESISDSTILTSSVTAASSTAVKSAYDLADSALQLAGGTMTGAITFVAGQTFPISGIQDATTGQKGVVQIGTNIQVSSGTISVNTATTGQLGLVQVGSNVQVSSGTISVNTATTGQLGLVQVGSNVQVSSGTISVNTATTSQLGLVQAGSNVQISGGTISILGATTTQAGVVQLNNTATSTSITEALTANQGKLLQDQITALSLTSNITLGGTFDSSVAPNGIVTSVTTQGTGAGLVVGNPLPAPGPTNTEIFVIIDVPGDYGPSGTPPFHIGDWYLSDGVTWQLLNVGFQAAYATTTVPGVIQLSTNAQTQTGTNTTAAVVPSALQSKMSDSTSTTSSTTIASSTAVKSAYDVANAAVPKACYTALGALAAGTGASTVGTLAIGTTGQFLAVNTACPSGLQWVTECFVNDATYAAKGDIVAGTGAGTYSALSVGTNGQFLTVNSACTTGTQWCTLSLACVPCSAFTAAGQLLAGTGTSTFTALTVGSNNQFLVADSACTGGLKWSTAQGAFLCGYTCTATPFNTAIGCGAGVAVTSSTNSTFVGNSAGKSVTSGTLNTAIGSEAGCTLTTNGNNTFVGACAGRSQTSGNNTAVGTCALFNSGTTNNTAVGFQTGAALTTGTSNTFVGSIAGFVATTASCTVAVGFNSIGGVHTASGTVAIGVSALTGVTSGSGNVAIGLSAGASLTTGGCNTIIGCNAGVFTTASNNTLIGNKSGTAITSGDSNTLVGSSSGTAITTGTCNVAMGLCALNGAGVINQANNVAIGAFAGAAVTLGANTLVGFCSGASLTGTSANTFIGCGAGRSSTTGQANTAIGCGAMGSGVVTGSNNFAGGILAGDALTSGSTNTFLGYTSGRLVTTGGQNTIIGAYGGTTALANNVVLADGAGTIRFQSNSSGAISLGAGGAYGTAGQILVSCGTAAAPVWANSAAVPANYGSFIRTTSQTNTGGASGNAVSFDATVQATNFSIVSGTQVTAAIAGNYKIIGSFQAYKTDAGTDDIRFWFKKNGVNIPNSAFNLTLNGNNVAQLATAPWIVTLAAGDYIEAWWYSADVDMSLLADPAVAPYPAVPAANLTIVPVGA